MSAARRIVGLLPMRHGSERVPGKNHRVFAGKPLFHHALSALLECPLLSEVVIDTDSPDVVSSVAANFPGVRLIDRPPELRAGTVPMNDVLVHDARAVPADLYVQTHATNPLLRAATLTAALQRFLDAADQYDSLFSVTRVHKRFWDAHGRPLNHDPAVLLRTQDLPPLFEENSCVYAFSRALILGSGNRLGARPLPYEIDAIEAWDIDDEQDFRIAEALYQATRTTGGGA